MYNLRREKMTVEALDALAQCEAVMTVQQFEEMYKNEQLQYNVKKRKQHNERFKKKIKKYTGRNRTR